jgi:hypothetical protein
VNAAARALVDGHYERACRVALKMARELGHDPDACVSAAGEALVKAASYHDGYPGETGGRFWALATKVIRHTVINDVRKWSSRVGRGSYLRPGVSEPSAHHREFEILEARDWCDWAGPAAVVLAQRRRKAGDKRRRRAGKAAVRGPHGPKRAKFLEVLRSTGNAAEASAAAGISRRTADKWRLKDPTFAESWERAIVGRGDRAKRGRYDDLRRNFAATAAGA